MPKAKYINPLDLLYQDLKADFAAMRTKPQSPIQSTYANPLNWTPGKAVEIIHVEAGSVGVFREYFHKLSPTARRLLPAVPGTNPDTSELVFGDWWLHPRNSAPVEADSAAEEAAIRKRFNELMDLELEPV